MEEILKEFVKPELLILIPVLYIIGEQVLKAAKTIGALVVESSGETPQ